MGDSWEAQLQKNMPPQNSLAPLNIRGVHTLSKAVQDFSSLGRVIFLMELHCKISQLSTTLLNDFDKTFVLAFYNYFHNIELNCDKENIF